jgi:hypothetical protein
VQGFDLRVSKNKQSPWSENGSKKYLWNERNVEFAIDYVVSRQDD